MSQIVLHKSGIDPDFHYTKKFMVDVDPLIGILIYIILSVLPSQSEVSEADSLVTSYETGDCVEHTSLHACM